MYYHVELYLYHLYISNQDYDVQWFMDRMGEFHMLMQDLYQAFDDRSYEIPDDGLPFQATCHSNTLGTYIRVCTLSI